VTSATRMPKLIAFEREEIVEIASDNTHGEIASNDLHAGDARHFTRKNRGLDLARDFKLFIDGEQAMLIGEGAVGGHIAEAADER
jgi:hypothetical protein